MDEVRRYVGKQFSLRGLSLNTDALSYLTEQLRNMPKEQRQRTMAKVLELVEKENVSSGLLNLDMLKEMLKILARQKNNESEINFKLENAIEWQKEIMEIKKQHYGLEKLVQSPLKQLSFNAYLQRYELVKRLLGENADSFASIDSLLTHRGKCILILAQLYRGDGIECIAEDHTGKIKLDLTQAQFEPGIFFEGGVFVFKGQCSTNGQCFQVENVKLPQLKSMALAEIREEQGFIKMKDPNDRIVFMSDINLDNEKVMRSIYHILQGFSTNPPNIFVFCGPFLSAQKSQGYTEQSTNAFHHLANILNQFSAHYLNTHFILVPSSEDPPPLQILPCPSLPPNVQKCFKDIRNMHFATNPCRLIFKDQQILIYRDDMVEKLSKSAVRMPRNANIDLIPKLFCNTIWSQRHLSPLPLFYNPVQPQFDSLFQLWPAPDLLVLADKFKAFIMSEDEQNRRLTLNPGPFSGGNFEFQVYYPSLKRVDQSSYSPEDR